MPTRFAACVWLVVLKCQEMGINQPQAKFGPSGNVHECTIAATPLASVEAMSEHYDVALKLTVVDKGRDSPVMVFIPRNHAIRLVKELASSVLANME